MQTNQKMDLVSIKNKSLNSKLSISYILKDIGGLLI